MILMACLKRVKWRIKNAETVNFHLNQVEQIKHVNLNKLSQTVVFLSPQKLNQVHIKIQ